MKRKDLLYNIIIRGRATSSSKLKFLRRYNDQLTLEQKRKIILSMQDNLNYVLEAIKMQKDYPQDVTWLYVIDLATESNFETKLKLLEELNIDVSLNSNNDYPILHVIKSFDDSSDDKVKALELLKSKGLLDNVDVFTIIDTITFFKDDSFNKLKAIDIFNLDNINFYRKLDIVDSFKEDLDGKIKVLIKFKKLGLFDIERLTGYELYRLIELLGDDTETRMKSLKKLDSKKVLNLDDLTIFQLSKVIELFGKDSESKLRTIEILGLKNSLNPTMISEIIKSFGEDSFNKLKAFGMLKLELVRVNDLKYIIDSFGEDLDGKFKALEAFELISGKLDLEKIVQLATIFEDSSNREYVVDKLENMILNILGDEKYREITKNDLEKLYRLFGFEFFKVLNNKNIETILQRKIKGYQTNLISPQVLRSKILDLFDNSYLDYQTINTIYNALIQREFKYVGSDILSVYANLLLLIENNKDINNIILDINNNLKVEKLFKNNNFMEIYNKIEYKELLKNDSKSFLIKLCYDIMTGTSNSRELKDILHIITNNYIAVVREKYLEKRLKTYYEDLKFEMVPRKKDLIRNFIKTVKIEEFLTLVSLIDKDKLSFNQRQLIRSESNLRECLNFLKNPTSYISKSDELSKKLKGQYLKIFNDIIDILYDNDLLNGYINSTVSLEKTIPKNNESLSVFLKLDLEQVIPVLMDERKFLELNNVLKKYKLTSWRDFFDKVLSSAKLDFNSYILSSFINNFESIDKQIKKRKLSLKQSPNILLTEWLEESLFYSSESPIYDCLLGKENNLLIKTNPSPNASTMSSEKRTLEAVEYIYKMYKRCYITIPTFCDVISCSDNNKKIKIIIGDTINTDNLTLGERTGSCMRLGGSAHSLFDFCLTNENGFHIRFVDPNTNSLISRVSGFRNGNTIFFNELRWPLNDKYNDSELVYACQKLSEMLIDKTKNSEYPIENIVVSPGYALEKSSLPHIELDCPNIKEGYGNLYSDVSSTNAIILATTNDDGIIKVNLGVDKVCKYEVLRKEVRVVVDPYEIVDSINRLNIINQIMKKKSLGETPLLNEDIILKNPNILSDVAVGEDWYCYTTSDRIEHEFILDDIPDIKRKKAREELRNIKEYFKEKNSEINKNNNIDLIVKPKGGTR